MKQLGLSFEPACTALVLQYGRIDCAFGESGIGWRGAGGAHYCHKCLILVAEAVRRFWQDVAAGIYDADGYTPAERKAQANKRRAA